MFSGRYNPGPGEPNSGLSEEEDRFSGRGTDPDSWLTHRSGVSEATSLYPGSISSHLLVRHGSAGAPLGIESYSRDPFHEDDRSASATIMKEEEIRDDQPGSSMLCFARPARSPAVKKSRKKTMIACIHCVKAKTGCDKNRPCGRCVRLGKQDTCVNRPITVRTRRIKRSSAPDINRSSRLEGSEHQIERRHSAPARHKESLKMESQPGGGRVPSRLSSSLEMNPRLMLDPHFIIAYASAQKTITAWSRFFKSEDAQPWDKEAKLTMAALITWMACADHQGCANQLYGEMLKYCGIEKIEPVQIHAKWKRDMVRLESAYPLVTYEFDYDYVRTENTLYCTIKYNNELIEMFTGEDVLRAMVPLSVKWVGVDN